MDLRRPRKLWYALTVSTIDARKPTKSQGDIASRWLVMASVALAACTAPTAAADGAGVGDAAPDAPACLHPDAASYPFEDVSVQAAPGVCFAAVPASDAVVADVPMPEHCPCAMDPPPFFGAAPVPAPVLTVEMGVGQAGAFVPYADGQWVPITHGPQGGIHVWVGWRLRLPGHQEPKVKLLARTTSHIDCALAGTGTEAMWYATPDPAATHAYTNIDANHPGTPVIFPIEGSESGLVCGRWLELRVQVQDPVAQTWGEVRRTVRLYDTLPWEGG